MTQEHFYVCPNCGSPSMSIPLLGATEYECEACDWVGPDPILVPVNNPFGSKHEMFQRFTEELLTAIAKEAALPIGRVLVKWGFVSRDEQNKPNPTELARYLKSATGGAIIAVLEERKVLEREER